MLSDRRLSLRTLVKARGFALISIFTLAVGISSTTAIFSALRALVFSPLHYPDADRLVHVWSGDGWPFSPADCRCRCVPTDRRFPTAAESRPKRALGKRPSVGRRDATATDNS